MATILVGTFFRISRMASWGLWGALIFVFLVVGVSDLAWSQVVTPGNVPCGPPVFGPLPPALFSVAPPTVTAGVRQQRLTITGNNFRPGAKVVITVPNTDPAQYAPDVAVSATVVNSGLIIAFVNVNRFSSGSRTVDVVNSDCTSTDGNLSLGGAVLQSPQQLFIISAGNTLAGPVQVDNLIVTYPREGTLVNQGTDLHAEAVLAGAGSGLVTGIWIWDGNVNEQFTANLAGGESTVLRTSVPLPTFYLGRHTLVLQITSPQNIQSHVVEVYVGSGEWKLLRLLLPRPGEGFSDANSPTLRWTPAPGVAKYEVGFSTQPYFNTVTDWYEVSDNVWKVPPKIWNGLPEGELYWTVRPVDISGEIREPARMRSLWRVPAGTLEAGRAQPRLSASGSVLLEWRGFRERVFYRLTVSRDAEGTNVVRRYLTASPQADLYAIRDALQSNQTFYWQVQAVSPAGQVIRVGPRQSFAVPAAHAQLNSPAATLRQTSLRATVISADLAASISRRSPASGESVSSDQPPIDITFNQAVDANKLALSVDGTDVTAVAEVGASTVKYAPVFPLDNGEHAVQLDVAPDSDNWKFKVVHKEPPPPLAPNAMTKNDAEVLPKAEAAVPKSPDQVGPEFKTHVGFDPQLGSSPSPNQLVTTGGEQTTFQRGPWRAELNGTVALDSLLSPSPQHLLGHVQDYIAQVAYKLHAWSVSARFGLIAPDMYTDGQFVTTATSRQAVEPKLTTPAGSLAYYANTNDVNLGGGDASSFSQIIRGAGYEAPLPNTWGAFRLMWMGSRDAGTPTTLVPNSNGLVPNSNNLQTTTVDPQSSPGAADAYGGFLKLHLPSNFLLVSEYAVAYSNPDTVPPSFPADAQVSLPYITGLIPQNGPVTCTFSPKLISPDTVPEACSVGPGGKRLFGRAWRTGLSGKWKKTTINVTYRDVTPNFSTPVNPSLTPLSSPGRQGLDSSVTQGTPLGDFNVGYQYLQSIVSTQDQPTTLFHNLTWGWRKGLKSKTQFAIRGHEIRTNNGTLPVSLQGIDVATLTSEGILIDQRDVGFNGSVMQQIRSLTLTGTASRDWFRNRIAGEQNSIVTGTQFGAVWRRQSFFQLQANVSANWAERDKTTIGDTRILSLYLMPMFMSQHTGLSLTPLASVTQTKGSLGSGVLTVDMLTSQLGGRLSWRLPARFRRATFSLEGARVQVQNSLATTAMPSSNLIDKRLAMLLSFAQDQTQGRL